MTNESSNVPTVMVGNRSPAWLHRDFPSYSCWKLTSVPPSATFSNVTMRNRQLTDLQQAIVDFIWKAGPSTAEQIREGLAPKHKLKDSTIRTLLRRPEDRHYLSHTVDGQVFVYPASVPPRTPAPRTVPQTIARFWSGLAQPLLPRMLHAP